MMRMPGRVGLCLVGAALVALAGCYRDHDSGSVPASQLIRVTPGSLSIPAGGGGFVTVMVSRSPASPGWLTLPMSFSLTLAGAPAGIQGTGTLAAGALTGTLALSVDPSVAPQTLQGLKVVATSLNSSPNLALQASLDLTIAPPLPPGQLRVDGVQASGGLQQAGSVVNTPVALEPVAVRQSTDSTGVESVRHGFYPAPPAD